MTAIAYPATRFRQWPATLPALVSAMAGNPATPGNAKAKALILLVFALPGNSATGQAKSLKSLRCRLPVSFREGGAFLGNAPPHLKSRAPRTGKDRREKSSPGQSIHSTNSFAGADHE